MDNRFHNTVSRHVDSGLTSILDTIPGTEYELVDIADGALQDQGDVSCLS